MRITLTAIFLVLFWSGVRPVHAQSNQIDSLLTILPDQKDSVRAETVLDIGDHYKRNGQTDSAIYYYTEYLEYQVKAGSLRKVFIGHISLGGILIRSMKFDESLTHFLAALSIAEKLKDYSFMADAKRSIAYILITQKRENKALDYLVTAEQDLLKVKDTMGLILLLPDLGYCKGKLGDTAAAINYFQNGFDLCSSYEASKVFEPARKESMIAKKLVLAYNMSDFLRPGDIQPALVRANRIWEDVKNEKNIFQQFQALSIIADLHMRLAEYHEAMNYAEKALATFSEEENDDMLKDVYLTASISAAKLNQYEKAYTYLNKFRVINDSLYNSEKNQIIGDIETKYETAKKEAAITSLHKERRIQRVMIIGAITGLLIVSALLFFAIRSKHLQKKLLLKNQELQRAALEKKMAELEQTALRAQMNPHFIFNCLNSVQRYVINNDVKGVNSYLSTFASLIRQTLENSGKQLVSLKDELKYLETYINVEKMRGGDSFEYEINVGEDIDTSDIYLPGMIIQPFVENSILYGMGDKSARSGKLKLTVVEQEKLIFVVEDNGPGIKKQDQLKPIEEGSHDPMGSSITAKRIEMYNNLHGEKIEFSITDKANDGADEPGTKVTLAFPIVSN